MGALPPEQMQLFYNNPRFSGLKVNLIVQIELTAQELTYKRHYRIKCNIFYVVDCIMIV